MLTGQIKEAGYAFAENLAQHLQERASGQWQT
jgi:hypothetical protein